MRRFQVEPGRFIEGYSSFIEAINAAIAHPEQRKAAATGKLLDGPKLVGGWGNPSHWCLEFEGSLWVEIAAQGDRVDWHVVHEAPAGARPTESYALQWSTGMESMIDPAKLVTARIGAQFWRFWVNEFGLWVYLRRKLTLNFLAVRSIDDGSSLLSVHEED